MDYKKALEELGLNTGEIKVYIALLKFGSSPVNKLKEETNLHRTTIYDFIEKLINKGLVNYIIKNNKKHYRATHPSKLIEMLKEKEDIIQRAMPNLIKLSEGSKEDLTIEVYKGVEGIKKILNDVLKVGKDYIILGVDESMFKKELGTFMDYFFTKELHAGFKERILTSDDTVYVYEYKTAIYRYLPKESFNPTPTYVWGDNVAIIIWEPLTVIRIKSASLADSYSKYFEILWKIAKTRPKNKLSKKKLK